MKIICNECRNVFLNNKFHPNQIYCSKKCYNKNWTKNNKDKDKQSKEKWRKSNKGINTEKLYRKNKWIETKNKPELYSKHLAEIRKYQKNNKDKAKEYRLKNKEKYNWHCLRRYYKMKGIIEKFTKLEWYLKLYKTHGFCPNCNNYLGLNKLTMDHIIPISKVPKGFIYTINDVQPLCVSCNSSKNNKIDDEVFENE